MDKHAAGNAHDFPDTTKQIIGAAALNLLKRGRQATPQALFTLIMLWEKQARNTQEKKAYLQALKLLSRKLN
ncbi:hypothetical protein ACX122_23830 [Kosakonia cowanii]